MINYINNAPYGSNCDALQLAPNASYSYHLIPLLPTTYHLPPICPFFLTPAPVRLSVSTVTLDGTAHVEACPLPSAFRL